MTQFDVMYDEVYQNASKFCDSKEVELMMEVIFNGDDEESDMVQMKVLFHAPAIRQFKAIQLLFASVNKANFSGKIFGLLDSSGIVVDFTSVESNSGSLWFKDTDGQNYSISINKCEE